MNSVYTFSGTRLVPLNSNDTGTVLLTPSIYPFYLKSIIFNWHTTEAAAFRNYYNSNVSRVTLTLLDNSGSITSQLADSYTNFDVFRNGLYGILEKPGQYIFNSALKFDTLRCSFFFDNSVNPAQAVFETMVIIEIEELKNG